MISPTTTTPAVLENLATPLGAPPLEGKNNKAVRETFNQFVGETFFSQMLKSLRTMTDKPAYFHGGRGEEVFQAQLDQVLAEKMAENCPVSFTGPMFDLFSLQRR